MRQKDERQRIYFKEKTSSNYRSELKKEIEKEKKAKQGIDCCVINKFLSDIPNFLGCFAQNELKNVK